MGWDISNIVINLKKKIGLMEDRTSQLETGLSNLSGVVAAEGTYGGEVLVGKWGTNDLYRKVIDFGAMPNAASKSVSTGVENVTYLMLYAFAQSSNTLLPLPNINLGLDPAEVTRAYLNASANTVGITTNVNYSSYTGIVVIYYTKNPPATRELVDSEEPKTKI